MHSQNNIENKMTIKQWMSQIVPPLLLLVCINENGAGMWFLLTIVVICLFFSSFSILFKLIKNINKRQVFLRPVLTLCIGSFIMALAIFSYQKAYNESEQIFINLSTQCEQTDNCDLDLSQWEESTRGNYSVTVGSFITYELYLYEQENGFKLYLSKSLEMGDSWVKVKEQ